jgi:hypothetical protein
MRRSEVVKTFKALLATYPGLSQDELKRVTDEFDQLLHLSSVNPQRRRMLLEIVHACRALESTLDVMLGHFGIVIADKDKSLGKFLNTFNSAAVVGPGKLVDKIDGHSKIRYQELVTKVRNNMMHRAGAYPKTEKDLDGFMSVVHGWLSHLMALS